MSLYVRYRERMTNRPRASLQRILEDLGSTVLDVAASPGELDAEVTGVHIYDPLDELLLPEGGILLAVGVDRAEQICALLDAAGPAAGVVVKQPVDVDELVRAKVLETGVAVLGLTRAASWAQVAALLRSLLAEGDLAEPGEAPPDDLFALANAVCALLDAPVTIEDRSSRVLAYSGRQDEADPGRVETVLGRQVPERYRRMLEERGFFRQLYQSREPIYMELDDDSINRAAVAVRSGDEILGSIWAAVREPLSDQRQRALADAAKIVALQLLRQRAGADTRRRLRADLLSTVLAGGRDAAEAAGRLGVASGRLCVLAAQLSGGPHADAAHRESDRQRFCDALALHVGAIHPKAAAALVGSVAYAVLPLHAGGGDEEARAVRVAESFLVRVGPRHAANIGVGRLAGNLAEVARSRADADRALRVLRAREASGAVAGYTGVHFEALLLRLSDLVEAEEQVPTGPYERLVSHDAEHGSELVATLRAYLDAFGDVNAASARVHVHANTFRYRLKRLAEISGLDLADPEARLTVMLQMRLFGR
ncbi:DNA-binding transcriptional regulator, PucR family [Streptosporangium canum]|uniref:DNA-binding transcriptional regulator, PucR family n=2 Tax=Streptosporangium canum TaxID=324952 RepID=A0A1I4DA68_9ACTN|nr:DNA-binding transcriptional regulator, PucR family [Streptosporangium canum]